MIFVVCMELNSTLYSLPIRKYGIYQNFIYGNLTNSIKLMKSSTALRQVKYIHWNRLDKKAFSRSRIAHLLLLQMHTLLHILLISYSIINGLDFSAKHGLKTDLHKLL